MKIQRGIVKYKDRNDIVCTYALTDDGKQYYFLDENDEKKFSNGNRIVTTALVEAVDPMVKSTNVGVIDGNGVIVIPCENRSIRPINDNVIVVEKAVPTTQSVLDAMELRNDPSSAAQLVSTPATIKDRMNAQMGVEGKYIFNDQFSEATICDINGTNLVNGESYSFISQANDKLYLSKNTADSPISEFSLMTYELMAAPVDSSAVEAAPVVDTNAVTETSVVTDAPIDVSTTVVDQQMVEDALASTTGSVDVQNTGVVADGGVATTEEDKHLIMTYNDSISTVQDMPVEETVDETVVSTADGAPENTVTDFAATTGDGGVTNMPVEGVDAVAPTVDETVVNDSIPAPVDSAMVDTVAGMTDTSLDPTASAIESMGSNENPEGTVDFVTAENSFATETTPNSDAPVGEFSAEDTSISDDLKAFANGFASDEEEVTDEVTTDTEVVDSTLEDAPVEVSEEESTDVKEETNSTDSPVDTETVETQDDETSVPPIVEEEKEDLPDAKEDLPEDTSVAEDTDLGDVNDEKEDAPVEDSNPIEEGVDNSSAPVEEVAFSDLVSSTDEDTSSPVTIDAETVLATVDRNKNGIIDSDEIMVPQHKSKDESYKPSYDIPKAESSPLMDIFSQRSEESLPVYNSSYTPSSYSNYGRESRLIDRKPDRISYDSYAPSRVKDNVIGDAARYMSELIRQIKDLRSSLAQYQAKTENLESENRTLAGQLRTLNDINDRANARNQSLEARVRELESQLAINEDKLKSLTEGKQDLVRMLEDASALLGSESRYGYQDDYSYYGKVA